MRNQHLFTRRDLAQHFRRYGLTMAWLRREAKADRTPSLKVGRRFLFNLDAVEAALIKQAQVKLKTPTSNRKEVSHAFDV